MAISLTSYVETQGVLRLCIFLLSGISMAICSDSSPFSNKLDKSEPILDLGDSDNGFLTSKYIMTMYYKKYKNLDDSDFKHFTKLPFRGSENLSLAPKLLSLERKLIGEGSHRHLYSHIRMSIWAIAELSQCNCEVIFVERLPLGVFADPFELQHLVQRGVFDDIAVFGDTNLEAPSFLSNQSAVEIHTNVNLDLSTLKNEIEIELKLPLHARYAPLSETGYSEVGFAAPDLFLRCGFEGKSFEKRCFDKVEEDSANLLKGKIVWKIPCGKKSHAGIVHVFTFMSASLAALLIVFTSIYHSSISTTKSSKQP